MSIVSDIQSDILLGRIPGRIQQYELLIDAAEDVFKLNGVNLEEACKKHAQNLMFYDVMLQECKTIEETIKIKVEEVEGQLFQQYHSNMNVKLSSTEVRFYVKGDPKLVQVMQILVEVQHTKRRLESIVEALKSFGWSLNNIVKIRISQLEDVNL